VYISKRVDDEALVFKLVKKWADWPGRPPRHPAVCGFILRLYSSVTHTFMRSGHLCPAVSGLEVISPPAWHFPIYSAPYTVSGKGGLAFIIYSAPYTVSGKGGLAFISSHAAKVMWPAAAPPCERSETTCDNALWRIARKLKRVWCQNLPANLNR
jgi:hypothetical protein